MYAQGVRRDCGFVVCKTDPRSNHMCDGGGVEGVWGGALSGVDHSWQRGSGVNEN